VPGPGCLRGYSNGSQTQMRPRSSKVIAVGLTTSGSAATRSALTPGGTCIFAIASRGDSAGPGGLSWPWGTCAGADAVANAAADNIDTIVRRTRRRAVVGMAGILRNRGALETGAARGR